MAAGPKRCAQRATIQVGCDAATASASTAAASSTWQRRRKACLLSTGAEVRSWSSCRHQLVPMVRGAVRRAAGSKKGITDGGAEGSAGAGNVPASLALAALRSTPARTRVYVG